jgi:predicted metal-dependent hydrolase
LILYNIDVMKDTQREMMVTQSDITVSRSKKKRRKTKRIVEDDDDEVAVAMPPLNTEAPELPADEE